MREGRTTAMSKTIRDTKFLAQYFHDGSWWSVTIYAADHDDAEIICKKLGLQLDGELIATIPGYPGAGWIANAVCAIRNFFWGSRS